MRVFLPSPRETNVLLLVAFAVFGYGLYLRHFIVEAPALAAVCAAGSSRIGCLLRQVVVEAYQMQLFGGGALVAAVVHVVRPRIATFTVALTGALLGLILYNAEASSLAVGIAIMGFVRPTAASTRVPTRTGSPQTKAPASSGTSH